MMITNDKYKTDKNFIISIIKLLFSIIIMLHHLGMGFKSWGNVNIINYVIVDCFFIISGFLFALHLERNRCLTFFQYMKKKILSIYPLYLFAFLIGIAVIIVNKDLYYKRQLSPASLLIELIMGQQLFIDNVNLLNGPDWYVTAWIIAGLLYFLVYSFLNHYGDIFSGTLFISYVIFFFNKGFMPNTTKPFVVIMGGAQRALCVMGLGILVYKIYHIIDNKMKETSCFFADIIFVIMISCFVLCIKHCTAYNFLGIVALFIMSVLLISSFYVHRFPLLVTQNAIIRNVVDSSLYVYLLHLPASFVHEYIFHGKGSKTGLLLTVAIIVVVGKFIDEKTHVYLNNSNNDR